MIATILFKCSLTACFEFNSGVSQRNNGGLRNLQFQESKDFTAARRRLCSLHHCMLVVLFPGLNTPMTHCNPDLMAELHCLQQTRYKDFLLISKLFNDIILPGSGRDNENGQKLNN